MRHRLVPIDAFHFVLYYTDSYVLNKEKVRIKCDGKDNLVVVSIYALKVLKMDLFRFRPSTQSKVFF